MTGDRWRRTSGVGFRTGSTLNRNGAASSCSPSNRSSAPFGTLAAAPGGFHRRHAALGIRPSLPILLIGDITTSMALTIFFNVIAASKRRRNFAHHALKLTTDSRADLAGATAQCCALAARDTPRARLFPGPSLPAGGGRHEDPLRRSRYPRRPGRSFTLTMAPRRSSSTRSTSRSLASPQKSASIRSQSASGLKRINRSTRSSNARKRCRGKEARAVSNMDVPPAQSRRSSPAAEFRRRSSSRQPGKSFTDFAEARRNLDANARSSSFSPPTRCSPARKITVALRRR